MRPRNVEGSVSYSQVSGLPSHPKWVGSDESASGFAFIPTYLPQQHREEDDPWMSGDSGPGERCGLPITLLGSAPWPPCGAQCFIRVARCHLFDDFLPHICFPEFNKHLLSPYSVPSTVLGTLYVCSLSLFWGNPLTPIDEETDTYPKLLSFL